MLVARGGRWWGWPYIEEHCILYRFKYNALPGYSLSHSLHQNMMYDIFNWSQSWQCWIEASEVIHALCCLSSSNLAAPLGEWSAPFPLTYLYGFTRKACGLRKLTWAWNPDANSLCQSLPKPQRDWGSPYPTSCWRPMLTVRSVMVE